MQKALEVPVTMLRAKRIKKGAYVLWNYIKLCSHRSAMLAFSSGGVSFLTASLSKSGPASILS
jgi:hypothetical protein